MKKINFLLVCVFIFLLSACGRTQNNSEASESGNVEVEYLKYDDFLGDMADEEESQILEKEIKDTLIQVDGIADAEVSVSRDDTGCKVSVNLIYDAEAEESVLENWVKNFLNTVFAGEENLILNINRD
ncbi:MAG: hypothetical protein NC123_09925 [Butyrivibrio sp.]|nr:hypothetical protein [Acetatifactor muris]MCM1559851.1 hypothetical protein [Butyrivibrio sp.]